MALAAVSLDDKYALESGRVLLTGSQALVRLPGFIVPLGPASNGLVHEFYLVPYIGEDIHVPPPPSNQMVYVRSATGIAAEALHEAYWVTGKMRVETRTTPLGTSAYSMVASKVEQYLN